MKNFLFFKKKKEEKKNLIFQAMEFSSPKLKKLQYFFPKKSYILGNGTF